MGRAEINRAEIDRARRTPEMLAVVTRKAHQAQASAESVSPRDTGDYASSFVVNSGVIDGAATARLANTDWKAGLIEFGTSDTPQFRPLGKGLDAATG